MFLFYAEAIYLHTYRKDFQDFSACKQTGSETKTSNYQAFKQYTRSLRRSRQNLPYIYSKPWALQTCNAIDAVVNGICGVVKDGPCLRGDECGGLRGRAGAGASECGDEVALQGARGGAIHNTHTLQLIDYNN